MAGSSVCLYGPKNCGHVERNAQSPVRSRAREEGFEYRVMDREMMVRRIVMILRENGIGQIEAESLAVQIVSIFLPAS